MDSHDELDIETYREAAELRRIGNRAVRKAQAENRQLGIPNAYSRRGRLYFELPSGELTEDDPFVPSNRANGES